MYFDLMNNFLFADSGQQMPVRLITASWTQNRDLLAGIVEKKIVHELEVHHV